LGFNRELARINANKAIFYVLSLVLYACGLMSKPMLVTTPFVLLLLDYWPLGRFDRKRGGGWTILGLIVEKLPFLILSIAAGVVTVIAQRNSDYLVSSEVMPLFQRLLNAVVSYSAYLKKLFWPTNLVAYYPYREDMPPELAFVAACLLILVSAYALVFRRKR